MNNLKCLSDSKRKNLKRRVSGIMAAVLLVTGIGTATYFQSKEVHAKDTLESISQVVRSINSDNPFTILEITPDSVSFNRILKNSYGNNVLVSGNQTLGYIGYYVKGYEPVRKDMDYILNDNPDEKVYLYSQLNDSELRYGMFDAFTSDFLSKNGIAYNTGKGIDAKPFYIEETDGYKEIRQGELVGNKVLSGNAFKSYVDKYGYKKLDRDYKGKRHNGNGIKYVDTATGVMIPSDVLGNGNYIKSYYPIGVSENNIAYDFLNAYLVSDNSINLIKSENEEITLGGFDDAFCYLSFNTIYNDPDNVLNIEAGEDREGFDFDPNIRAVELSYDRDLSNSTHEEEETPEIWADFRYDKDLTRGYLPIQDSIINLSTKSTDELREFPLELPVYAKFRPEGSKEDVFRYVGTLNEIYNLASDEDNIEASDNSVVSSNYVEPDMFNITTTVVENKKMLSTIVEETDEIGVLNELDEVHENDEEENDSLIEEKDKNIISDDDKEQEKSESVVSEKDDEDNIHDEITAEDNVNYLADVQNNGDEAYYTLNFYYTNDLTEKCFYSINSFKAADKNTGAQYKLNWESEDGVIVPNITGHGILMARDSYKNSEDMFIYDYSEGNGNYNFQGMRRYSSSAGRDFTPYKIRGAEIWYKIDITNNEWFKRNILDRNEGDECKNLPVVVNSKIASEVSDKDIVEAKLIVLMSGDTSFCICSENNIPYTYVKKDLSVKAARNLLSVVVNNSIPVIGDYRIVSDVSANMVQGMIEPVTSRIIKALQLTPPDRSSYLDTISSFGDATIESNPELLLTNKVVSSNNFVNESVYIYNRKIDGKNISFLNDKLMESFSDKVGFEDVETDIKKENLYRRAEKKHNQLEEIVSQATTIRYIIGFSHERQPDEHKGEMRILEIEPCATYDLSTDANETDDDGNIRGSKLYINKGKDNEQILIDQEGTRLIVTRMTSAEFIGRIEDINVSYDMIYLGMNSDKFNTRAINRDDVRNRRASQKDYDKNVQMTDYNDPDMDGLVYSNVGDYVYIRINLAGMLENERKSDGSVKSSRDIRNGDDLYKTRYSGNDITEEKLEALKGFVNAGYPVVMADDFFDGDNVNQYKIDTASFMYKFVNDVKGEDNVFRLSLLSQKLFMFYMNLSKPTLTMVNNEAIRSMSRTEMIAKSSDGYFYVPFNFTVNNKGAVSATDEYNVNLFIDVNSDGKYSSNRESVDFRSLKNAETGEDVVKASGTYTVKPGVVYEGTYRLSGAQVGVIPWRIVVTQKGNTNRRANATGYYQLSNNKPEVKVLQINSVKADSVDEGKNFYVSKSVYGYDDGRTTGNQWWAVETNYSANWNMQMYYDKGADGTLPNKFYEYITRPEVPYDIRITTWTSTKFSAQSSIYTDKCVAKLHIPRNKVEELTTKQRDTMSVELSTYDEATVGSIKQQYKDVLEGYDMVIMGFGDNYVAPNVIAVDAIKDYVDEGHSILFTHDCTSTINALLDENGYSVDSNGNVPNNNKVRVIDGTGANTGYECNIRLRHMVGMDRYNALKQTVTSNTFEKDGIYKPRTQRTDSNLIKDTQIHGFTYGNINTCGYFDENKFGPMYGNTTGGLTNIKGIDHTTSERDYGWQDNKDRYIYAVGQYNDMSVKRVNKGQITEYPFHLDETFSVANTHMQWYQLDFNADDDNDGESDIVVWYCIDGSSTVNDTKDMYALSPGDVRNNYYIYNKGNVTYSGVGHSGVMEADSDNEIKLFINTMVAAYRSGLHAPDLTFKEGYNGKRNTENIYVTYDEQLEYMRGVAQGGNQGGLVGLTKDVYFLPEQVSIVQNASNVDHKLSAIMYYEVPAGTEGATTVRYNGADKTVKALPIIDNTASDIVDKGVTYKDPDTGDIMEGDLSNLKNNAVYKVSFKLDQMKEFMGTGATVKNAIKLYVVTTDTVTTERSGVSSTTAKTSVNAANIIRTEVFNLD